MFVTILLQPPLRQPIPQPTSTSNRQKNGRAMGYDTEYVFPLVLTPAWRAEIQRETQSKLTDMLGVEVDTVMAVRTYLL